MTQRDWEKELAKIDRQLAALPDEALLPPAAPASPGTGMPRGPAAPAGRGGAAAPAAGGRVALWSWAKLAVAGTAAVGLWLWPWPAPCGLRLAGLVAAAGGAVLLGLWSAIGTWRSRLGFAHALSLLAIVSAVVLGAREVLPRVGYARPTVERPATWACEADAPPAAPGTPSPTPPPAGGPSALTL